MRSIFTWSWNILWWFIWHNWTDWIVQSSHLHITWNVRHTVSASNWKAVWWFIWQNNNGLIKNNFIVMNWDIDTIWNSIVVRSWCFIWFNWQGWYVKSNYAIINGDIKILSPTWSYRWAWWFVWHTHAFSEIQNSYTIINWTISWSTRWSFVWVAHTPVKNSYTNFFWINYHSSSTWWWTISWTWNSVNWNNNTANTYWRTDISDQSFLSNAWWDTDIWWQDVNINNWYPYLQNLIESY